MVEPANKELFYDSIADQWDSFMNKAETEKRLRVVFELLFDSSDLTGKTFLDVGCGLGFFSRRALECGADLTSVDIGESLVSCCSQLMPQATFQVASATALPFADDSFERVLCTEVIEHVANPQQAVGELLRVLRPGGRLVLTTPNRVFKPMFDLLSLTRIRPYHGYENWLFTWQLRREIEQRGGRILKTHCFNFFYPCRPLDFFERFAPLGNLMINQGYLITI